jgi:hypothetical protein
MDDAAAGLLFAARLRALRARRAELVASAEPQARKRPRSAVVPDTLARAFFDREYAVLFSADGALRRDPPSSHDSLHYATLVHNFIQYPDLHASEPKPADSTVGLGEVSQGVESEPFASHLTQASASSSIFPLPPVPPLRPLSVALRTQRHCTSQVELQQMKHQSRQQQQRGKQDFDEPEKQSQLSSLVFPVPFSTPLEPRQLQHAPPSHPPHTQMVMQRRTYYRDWDDAQGERRASFAEWVDDAHAAPAAAAVEYAKRHRPADDLQGYNDNSVVSFPPLEAPILLRDSPAAHVEMSCGYGYNSYRVGRADAAACECGACNPLTDCTCISSMGGCGNSEASLSAIGFQRQTYHPFRALPAAVRVNGFVQLRLRPDQLQQHHQQKLKQARTENKVK